MRAAGKSVAGIVTEGSTDVTGSRDMNHRLAALLLPLRFTAPTDSPGPEAAGSRGQAALAMALRHEAAFTLHDGSECPRVTRLGDLVEEWEPAGSLAPIVRQRAR
jgi:hypothetical protein